MTTDELIEILKLHPGLPVKVEVYTEAHLSAEGIGPVPRTWEMRDIEKAEYRPAVHDYCPRTCVKLTLV